QVVAVTDLRPDRARKLGESLNARVYATVAELLADPEVEAVDICVPTPEHGKVVLAAAAARKHVLCEKPIARTMAEADEMIAACRQAGVTFMVAHVMRWESTAEKARQVVESGVLGPVRLVRMTLGGSFPTWGVDNWFADYAKSGGPFLDLVIHNFDWLNWVFGPVQRVFASNVTDPSLEQGDYGLAILKFKSGVIAHVEAIWNAPEGFPFEDRYEIAGTQGLYEYGDHRPPIDLWVQGGRQAEAPHSTDGYAEEIRHFIACCQTGETPRVRPEEAREAIRIGLAVVQSAATGQPVLL
ncbi:MAG: dehydrogenase, partial [Firmicutes bacterium]|nr:dehydrogenase [Bacillota bacterium]